jgi:hypothetical protein
MLFKEIIAVCSDNSSKQIYMWAKLLIIKAGGRYSYHCNLLC